MSFPLFCLLTYVGIGVLLFLNWAEEEPEVNPVLHAMVAVAWLPCMLAGLVVNLFAPKDYY